MNFKRKKFDLLHGGCVVICIGAALTVPSERLLGFAFNAAFWKSSSPSCTGTIVCGTNSGDNCYTGSTSAAAIAAGYAQTPSGNCLVISTGAGGFKVWTEQGGTKILKATGLDDWQMTLNPTGRGFSSTYANSATLVPNLEGRVCPTNVYIDDSNKVTIGNCLYYTPQYAGQTLNKDGDDSGARLGFTKWTVATWYRGNLKTCSDIGMRLPTLYETASSSTNYLPTDASPTFSPTTGVPSNGTQNWTASVVNYVYNYENFHTYCSLSYCPYYGPAFYTNSVRCVLP